MRYSVLLPALASLAFAQDPVAVADNPDPTPDALPIEDLRDIQVPTFTEATGVTAQEIPYATASAIAVITSEVAATPLSIFPAATDVPINAAGEDGIDSDEDGNTNVIVNTGSKLKRALTGVARQPRRKRAACDPQPIIANTYNVDVSTPDAFADDATIYSVAETAKTPAGYYQNFANKQAANSAMNYLGYYVLPEATYDVQWCADKCDATSGCFAFNIYFERDPTVDPGVDCPDPEAFANIKCSFWGTGLDEKTLTNSGQWREKFWVSIAGSNAYTSYKMDGPVAGWDGPQKLNTTAINAPLYDCQNRWSYLGYKLLQAGSVDPNLCAAACDAQTAYNAKHPTATDPYPCNAFGSYILTKTNSTGSYQQGQMCALYTAYWDAKFAKNTGSSDPSIGAKYTYSHSTFYGKQGVQPVCAPASDYISPTGTYIKGGSKPVKASQ
jgi:hypothetical protein